MNKALERALEHLSTLADVSAGCVVPPDDSYALALFNYLLTLGVRPDDVDVYKWALLHGWPERYAQEIKNLARSTGTSRRRKGIRSVRLTKMIMSELYLLK